MPSPATANQTAIACAKVNLALHVTGQRADGYHLLESLVSFTELGDRVTIGPGPDDAADDTLDITGPFASSLPGAGNILLTTSTMLRNALLPLGLSIPPLQIRLEKHLPVASGIGGGSADAAALLRLLTRTLPAHAQPIVAQCALRIGADVPMCLRGKPALATGIGEALQPLAECPALPIVLVNPGVSVSTPAIFRNLARKNNPALPALPASGFATAASLIDYLQQTRNDLQPPAITYCPEIADCLGALAAHGADFTRMSGSGATVFGLFDTLEAAQDAVQAMRTRQPHWWVQATLTISQGKGASQ